MLRGWLRIALVLNAVGAGAAPLEIAQVKAPEIACVLASDCSLSVEEATATFALGTTSDSALLHSAVWQPEPATSASGIRGYVYRLDLTAAAGPIAQPCVTRLVLEFGPITPLDYDGDGDPDRVFVVTTDDTRLIEPSAAGREGTSVVLHFARGVCAGASSVWVGLASPNAPVEASAFVRDSVGQTHTVAARVPALHTAVAWWKNWQVWLVLVVVTAVGFLMSRRR